MGLYLYNTTLLFNAHYTLSFKLLERELLLFAPAALTRTLLLFLSFFLYFSTRLFFSPFTSLFFEWPSRANIVVGYDRSILAYFYAS